MSLPKFSFGLERVCACVALGSPEHQLAEAMLLLLFAVLMSGWRNGCLRTLFVSETVPALAKGTA